MATNKSPVDRRDFLKNCGRVAVAGALVGVGGLAMVKGDSDTAIWQLDPALCTQCGKCATDCVLTESAVKCTHTHDMCGYCTLCFGYFQPGAAELNEGAENQLCPTGAIKRTFIEEPYFEYNVDGELCIGCAKCVKGCNMFGNGSLRLQVLQDRCINCNECAIAKACPSNAFSRAPSRQPYKLSDGETV